MIWLILFTILEFYNNNKYIVQRCVLLSYWFGIYMLFFTLLILLTYNNPGQTCQNKPLRSEQCKHFFRNVVVSCKSPSQRPNSISIFCVVHWKPATHNIYLFTAVNGWGTVTQTDSSSPHRRACSPWTLTGCQTEQQPGHSSHAKIAAAMPCG